LISQRIHIGYLGVLLWILFTSLALQGQSDTLVFIETPFGEMTFKFHEETPKHKKHFIQLAEEGYWDTLTFNRIIEDFVVQGGCPDTKEGFQNSPYLLKEEIHPSNQHVFGALGAGRDMNPEKQSAYCQFYIVHHLGGVHRLDGDYTIFGQLIKGREALIQLGKVPTDSMDAPIKEIPLKVSIIYPE